MKRIILLEVGIFLLGLLSVFPTVLYAMSPVGETPVTSSVVTQCKTHEIGNVEFTITNWGFYGGGDGLYCPDKPNAEWPSGSDVEYLFIGGLWIGAIVNNDTIVSTSAEGWTVADETGSDLFEMFPGDGPGDTIVADCITSQEDYLALFSDTVGSPYAPEHTPLGVLINQKTFAWTDTTYDDFIMFDYTLYNIDTFVLQDLYIGNFFDADVGPNFVNRHEDDISGFIDTLATSDTVNISWSKDDDGDGGFSPGFIGMKTLNDVGVQPSFNWWISNEDCDVDYGHWNPLNPNDSLLLEIQRTVCPTDSHPGTPMDDVSKYLLMSNGEIDCDQEICPPTNPPNPPAGGDTKILHSYGPFLLLPGDSLSITFAIGFGDSLNALIRNLTNAQEMYDSNFTIDLLPFPISGLSVSGRSDSSITLDWPPRCAYDLGGYNLYRSETSGIYTVPINSSPVPDTFYEDADTSLVEGTRYYYVVTVLDTFGRESGYSNEVSTVFGKPWIPQNLTAAAGNGFIDLAWDPSSASDFLGYNLYRSITSGSLYTLIDTLGTVTNYTDVNVTNGVRYYYVVTAVDTLLYESEFSNEATALPMGLNSGILVVDATYNLNGSPGFPSEQQVDDFYDLMLTRAGVTSYDTLENSDEGRSVTLVDFAPYSTVIWHSDDPVFPRSPDINVLREYLNAGGRLWITGQQLLTAVWGEDRLFTEEYLNFTDFSNQPTNDFIGADGILGYPTLDVDSNKVFPPDSGNLNDVSIFSPINPSEVIYLFNSASGDTQFHDQPTALCRSDSIRVAAFGFPLYPMVIDSTSGEPLATMTRMVLECLGEPSVGIEEEPDDEKKPSLFSLSQSIPNPFNHKTSFRYQLPAPVFVSLKVYDITGRLVRTLVDKEEKEGFYRRVWDGRDETQKPVSSGIYFVRLSAQETGSSTGDYTSTKKMILLR
jgi:hypothetical protein